MANIRHVVVIRKDLDMAPGLMAAQVAHIGDAFMRKRIIAQAGTAPNDSFTDTEREWMIEPYITVLGVNNPEELKIVMEEAKAAHLKVNEWIDLIPSEILNRNMPGVLVGCSIGPADSDELKAITGNLPLA